MKSMSSHLYIMVDAGRGITRLHNSLALRLHATHNLYSSIYGVVPPKLRERLDVRVQSEGRERVAELLMSCTMCTRLRHSPFVWLLGLLQLRVGLLALGINSYLIFGAARLARLHVVRLLSSV